MEDLESKELKASAGDASHDASPHGDVGDVDMKEVQDDNGPAELSRDGHLATTNRKSHATDTIVATTMVPPRAGIERQGRTWRDRANPLRWGGRIPEVPEERIVSREYRAGFLSKLTFDWMSPLMITGCKRRLEQGDIWAINPDRAVEPLTKLVRESFRRRIRAGDKHPLFWALHDSFIFEFWIGGLCALVGALPQVIAPFTLRFLIQFATDAYQASVQQRPRPPIGRGAGLVVGITAMQILQSLCVSHFIYRGMMIGGQSRGVLISMVYEKAMVISGRARGGGAVGGAEKQGQTEEEEDKGEEADVGEKKANKRSSKDCSKDGGIGWANGSIVNLMSVDTYRIDQASAFFHMIWTAPILCLITLMLLLVNLAYSALAGFALLVLGVLVLTRAIRSLFRRREAINKITDQRVSLTQEILQSVRFVKYFGWEKAFLDRLAQFRAREIHAIQVLLAIRNAINAVSMSLPIFASMLSFIVYSLSHHDLSPAEVFSSLALFNGLRIPLNLLTLVLGQVTDAWSSLQRIEQFLTEEEQDEDAVMDPEGPKAIELRGAAFTWEWTTSQDPNVGTLTAADNASKPSEAPRHPGSAKEDGASTLAEERRDPFKLQGLDLQAARNELIAVIGSVGSGKSSLLAALAGDMRKTSGNVVFGGSRAFCPQYAWIQNTTLQNNITFGKDMDKRWYRKVIKACALEADLDMLPNGDQTEIGERGITISGGQKQRLNLARAIYFDTDIVLMDDPLSAVDAHVGRHIFDQAILGLLGDKCRILATHQLWVLAHCDRIIWMEGGKIMAVGTFEELLRDHRGVQVLMEMTAEEDGKNKKMDEGEDEAMEGEEAAAAEAEAAGGPDKETKWSRQRGAALMQQEERSESSVPWSVYGAYVRASGSLLNAPLLLVVLVLSQGANIMTSLWLSYWTSDRFGLSAGQYMGVYAGLGAIQALLIFLFSVLLSVLGTRASWVMLRDAVTRVLRAPMAFFDTTPLGRITNRFSRDVDVMDNNLTDAFRMFNFTLAMVIAVFALIVTFFHYFAFALVPLCLLFVMTASYYRASAREVKRFESAMRSHVFAKFGEGLSGVATIRAYGVRARFVGGLRAAIDDMNAAYYLTFAMQRWLSVRLDLVGNALVVTVAILVVTSRFNVDPSISGLVLSYILSIVQMLQFSIRQLVEVENGMNAVERLHHYGSELDEEAPAHTVDVRASWPETGDIVFDGVEMRYRDKLPLVLRGLSMHVAGGERVGIVGRTGAGKSSIVSTLFRLVEISGGSITIDGLDIATVGLHDLRSRLAIIPQDPTLFRGSVRSNLDPFGEHSDLKLWSALRQVDLVPEDPYSATRAPSSPSSSLPATTSSPSPRIHLDSAVEEDGVNFSLGQRQLMALARALVRGSKIIVCDEATSSVDMVTDDRIQRTMATAFRGKTLLCIAHRLRTIIAYDRVCVMDAGRIAELDTPLALWHRHGIFRGMCDRSGIRLADIQVAGDATPDGQKGGL
ncbi:ABC transporter transmembrane domain-containing protein [Hirsutella rhossiliensis]|uniref:ABC transporter transmembrane domain-containing protein n=1 Tax=Hirsutella rhossiliensis TaxID=111463 RepID=A0A9P8ML86_9HYPO|nr:ABC transporter transmembrane domain-containing protein [Hirsutella rhossiliensis]KAH0957190.1 ABC transporter transmembrane domain-containing protein [Hirsutella rhossiliensis]